MLSNRTKLELIVDGVISFRATAGQIRDGVGRLTRFSDAARQALSTLEAAQKPCIGLVSDFNGFTIQISLS